LTNTLLGILLALFLLNVVLGTLGTFWLQLRKRTEDIGIMRSFGAKRRDIFLQIWGEAAILTILACLVGCLVWFQFAIHWDLLSNGNAYGSSGLETDWVVQFWPHFLIVSAVQCLLLLAIVTLGMVVPTFRAMYKHPVEALHHE
jgi:ABC-type antimicrobial peptide transport system permease subunit